MSELAYDLNGEPITLPASAQWWRVRRFRNPGMRGAPEVVTDRDGAPLVLPIDTAFTDFREEVDGVSGRYRLDPLDERRKVVPDARSGMPMWQDRLFIFLQKNAANPTEFFHIPPGRVIELGAQMTV